MQPCYIPCVSVHRVECLVAGAGVIGLSVARALAHTGWDVVVAESASRIGTGISARNSEVIHAGIYYPPGSAKARLCVRGREALYRYCQHRGIAHRGVGKLIVATEDGEVGALEELCERGRQNGVDDLVVLGARDAKAREPEVRARGALWSPSTGIVDAHGLMRSLLGDVEDAGGAIAVNSRVRSGRVTAQGTELDVVGEDGCTRVSCEVFVNAAGLGAQALARSIEGFPECAIAELHLAKGNYFALAGRAPFAHLVYPVPQPGGLGVHYTMDLGGRARFGPDVQWVQDAEDLTVETTRAERFYHEVRRYWPGLPDGALSPDFVGMRPKIVGAAQPPADFAILGPAEHGVARQVHLFGIESPGLTAALAIGDEVARLLER